MQSPACGAPLAQPLRTKSRACSFACALQTCLSRRQSSASSAGLAAALNSRTRQLVASLQTQCLPSRGRLGPKTTLIDSTTPPRPRSARGYVCSALTLAVTLQRCLICAMRLAWSPRLAALATMGEMDVGRRFVGDEGHMLLCIACTPRDR